jgi:glycosyltransferase involved in cell wall biosynthesis
MGMATSASTRVVPTRHVLVLATHLSREQAGAAHATIDFINALATSGWAAVTVCCYSCDRASLAPGTPVVTMVKPEEPPLLWRVSPLFAVARIARALAPLPLPAVDACYTQTTQLGLAYRRLRPRDLIISHTGHVVASREYLEEVERPTLQARLHARLTDRLERQAYQTPRWRHVVSTRRVAEQRAAHYGLPPTLLSVRPLGIDSARFDRSEVTHDVRSELGIPPDAFVLITVARLVRWKNIQMAVDAVARLHSAHLVVVGSGPDGAALRDRARASGVAERVHFVGHRHPTPYLAAADVFVLPSTIESFGMVYAEAMHLQLPCIGLRHNPPEVISSAEDVIPEGVAGYCVSTPGELHERLVRLQREPLLRRRLGAQARQLATAQYSAAAYAGFIRGLIEAGA